MTRSLNVTPKTTEQHLIVRSVKYEAQVTIIKESARSITLLKLTTDGHKASRGLSATAQLLVTSATAEIMRLMWFVCLFICLSFCLCAVLYWWTAGQRIDPSRNSTFVWRTSITHNTVSLMTYTNWLSGQPHYWGQRQSCMYLWARSYKWDNADCSSPYYSVCELDIRTPII